MPFAGASVGPRPWEIDARAPLSPSLISGSLRIYVGALDAEGSDEDVDDDNNENTGRGHVFQDVQPVVHALVVQVPLHCENRDMTS